MAPVRAAVVVYWMIRSGQPLTVQLICFTIFGFPLPRLAFGHCIGVLAAIRIRNMSSAVTGAVRWGSGVTTGVGSADGGADVELDGPQAATINASRPIAPSGNR